MLTQIRATSPRNPSLEPLVLPIGGQSRFPISFIDGLGPSNAEISTSKYAIVCGEHFEGSRVNMRNIMMTLELSPNYGLGESPESLRAELYRYFATRHEVELEFTSSRFGIRKISGYVESFEAPLFVEEPAVQISILCPDPYFKAGEEKTVGQALANGGSITYENEGDIATGLIFQINGRTTSYFTLENQAVDQKTTETMQFNVTVPDNTSIRIETTTGRKSATMSYVNIPNLLPLMTSDSQWLRAEPGTNKLYLRAASGTVWGISISYTERFIGL